MNNDNKLLVELELCETTVWDALVSGDIEADSAALHQSFLGVHRIGISPKSGHVSQLENGPTIKSFALSDLHARYLGDDHALLSYRADFTRAQCNDQEIMYVSSIWQRTLDGWINIFSQDTPAAI